MSNLEEQFFYLLFSCVILLICYLIYAIIQFNKRIKKIDDVIMNNPRFIEMLIEQGAYE
jgi:amino acid permease